MNAAYAIVNFAQMAKNGTCSTTITQYNSNDSLTPEFKRASFEKRNNFNELLKIPTKAEERKIYDPNFV